MSGRSNSNNNFQNPQMMQQQFGQQGNNANFSGGGMMPAGMAGGQQQRGGTPLQQQHQQRMNLLEQMQRQQQQGAVNPLLSPPGALGRPPNALAPAASSSSGSLSRMNSATSVNSRGGKGAAVSGLGGSNVSLSAGMPLTKLSSTVSLSSQGKEGPDGDQVTEQMLKRCDWKDKTLWVSRQLLGGNATNGFLRSTATVQRIKRQRARQTAQTKQKQAGEDKKKGKDDKDKDKDSKDDKNKKRDAPDQAAEEELKKEVMNPRTAKKIKAELQSGLAFCVTLHNTIRSILYEMDPQIAPHTPLPLSQGGLIPTMKQLMPGNPKLHPAAVAQAALAGQVPPPPQALPGSARSSVPTNTAKASASAPPGKQPSSASANVPGQRRPSDASVSKSSQASPGEPGGSTLRKNRKKKLPPNTEKPVALAEFDSSGKRLFSKKEHSFRVFEAIRFRALKQGDFVAARVSSRDLWILARVQKDYPGFTMPPAEFLKLSEAKRDATFREKVQIKDVEDKGGSVTMVSRNLVLPLPRTFAEAAEWCQRSKKGSRVYAMYPHTTSLYSATVVDNTTYCRQDDDIIVVEFDGDEPDATGALPKYHIPARFVTLIPREFPASQTNSKKRKSLTSAQAAVLPNASSKSKRSSVSSARSAKSNDNNESSNALPEEDPLGSMIGQMGFEDLVSTNSLDDLEQFDFDFSDMK